MKKDLKNNYGHCCYCLCSDENCSMIYNLFIKKEYRKMGHAKEFILQAIKEIRETGYSGNIKIVAEPEENSISKEDLIKFYENIGLKVI